MAIARITGQGLTALAILVGLLWACVIGERVIVRRATAETTQALREMRRLRIRTRRQPATAPAPSGSRRPHSRLG